LSFTSLGEMSYKNIPQPVRTFAVAEADGLGILPAPARQRRIGAGRLWAAAAIVLLLAAAGAGVWGYSDYRRSRAEAAHAAAVAAQKTADEATKAAQQRAALAAQKRAVEEARQRAEADQQAADAAQQECIDSEANRLAKANRKGNEATQLAAVAAPPRVAPPQPNLPPSPAALPRPASAGDPTGVYGGLICFGPGEIDPARCFRAQAVVRNRSISGQWPGRIPGATVYLAGDVTRAGDVAIHMHTKRADGSRFAVIDLVGKLRDGRIDATGSFRNGRSVTLNWRKD
jgi:hypothetical protein